MENYQVFHNQPVSSDIVYFHCHTLQLNSRRMTLIQSLAQLKTCAFHLPPFFIHSIHIHYEIHLENCLCFILMRMSVSESCMHAFILQTTQAIQSHSTCKLFYQSSRLLILPEYYFQAEI